MTFYAHYDGQPVDSSKWKSGPWRPEIRSDKGIAIDAGAAAIDPSWRIFARSASDDKSPIIALLAAVDALRSAREAA